MVDRCATLEDFPKHLAAREIKLHMLDTLLVANKNIPLSDEGAAMVLKDLAPKEEVEDLGVHDDLHGGGYGERLSGKATDPQEHSINFTVGMEEEKQRKDRATRCWRGWRRSRSP